jgi:hypothetical protein
MSTLCVTNLTTLRTDGELTELTRKCLGPGTCFPHTSYPPAAVSGSLLKAELNEAASHLGHVEWFLQAAVGHLPCKRVCRRRKRAAGEK